MSYKDFKHILSYNLIFEWATQELPRYVTFFFHDVKVGIIKENFY
jgi:hypothetical protein